MPQTFKVDIELQVAHHASERFHVVPMNQMVSHSLPAGTRVGGLLRGRVRRERERQLAATISGGHNVPHPAQVGPCHREGNRKSELALKPFDDILVMTSRTVMFVDVDTTCEHAALALLWIYRAINPEFSCRVYRTRKGLRYLCTSAEYYPGSGETYRVLRALGSDPRYIRRVTGDHLFVARMSPKPERCDGRPHDQFATCEFVSHEGSLITFLGCAAVVSIHDMLTAAHSGLPLA